MRYWIWKLRVCWYSLRHLSHWPWGDLHDSEWRNMYDYHHDDPWGAFVEGWGEASDLGTPRR